MPRKSQRGSKRSGGSRSRSGGPRTMAVLDPIQVLSRSLASREDRCVVKDKIFVQLGIGHAALADFPLVPASFGSRVVSIASAFDRWRILKLNLCPISYSVAEVTGGPAVTAVGIADDPDLVPTTFVDIVNLRSSAIWAIGTIVSGSNLLTWSPVDPRKEFFTSLPSGSDIRLQAPGSVNLWYNGTVAQTIGFTMYYTIEFVGSSSVGGT